MNKFKELCNLSKGSVTLYINEHRSYYETIKDYLEDDCLNDAKEIDPEVLAKIIELDFLVKLTFYPDTPIGFYEITHYDINTAIDYGLALIKGETDEKD